MIFIDSAKSKKKNKKKDDFFKVYWKLLEPPAYVDLMVADILWNSTLTKLANKNLKEVSLKGTLHKNDSGFVYVKVDDDVIHGMYTLIDEEGISEPPYFGKGDKKIGAHISAISQDELEEKDVDIKDIKEIGDEVNFTLGEMYSTNPDGWDEMKKVYFISVDAPELKEIRKSYGLPATYKNKGHDFHITVAVEKA
jgi:hypothetical protein